MSEVVDRVVARAAAVWGYQRDRPPGCGLAGGRRRGGAVHARGRPRAARPARSRAPPRLRHEAGADAAAGPVRMLDKRLAEAGVDPAGGVALAERKPEWLRVKARMGEEYRSLRRTLRQLDLVTRLRGSRLPQHLRVLGGRHRHLHDQRGPLHPGLRVLPGRHPQAPAPDPDEPRRVAEAVARLGLGPRRDHHRGPRRPPRRRGRRIRRHRAGHPRADAHRPRSNCSSPTAKASRTRWRRSSRPDRTCSTTTSRPSPGCSEPFARPRRTPAAWPFWPGPRRPASPPNRDLIVGMGERVDEVVSTLADLHGVGVDIVTVGQYLRPTSHHLPGGPMVAPGGVPAAEGSRRGPGPPPRGGVAAHPVELPRPPGGCHGGGRPAAAATSTAARSGPPACGSFT